MKSPKRGSGFLKGAMSLIMDGVEEDAPAPVAQTAPPPQQSYASSNIPAFAFQAAPQSSAPAPKLDYGILAPAPSAPNPEAVKVVQDAVYTAIGDRPSRFLPFLKMHERLGRPADITVVIEALQITDAGFTLDAVASDARSHLELLEKFCGEVDADFANETNTRIGSRDGMIADLQKQNDNAAAEIQRHQTESAERLANIQVLQAEKAQNTAELAHAKQTMDTAEDYVRASLNSAISLFASPKV